jgi:hypothetical protein
MCWDHPEAPPQAGCAARTNRFGGPNLFNTRVSVAAFKQAAKASGAVRYTLETPTILVDRQVITKDAKGLGAGAEEELPHGKPPIHLSPGDP